MSFVINGKELPPIAICTWAWGSGTNGSKMVFGSKSNPEALKESFDIAFKMLKNFLQNSLMEKISFSVINILL